MLKRAGRKGEHLPLEAVLSMGAGLASALDYAHHATDAEGRALQIVHRDVTPQNILLARSGEVKLIDFGVARAEQRFLRTTPGLVKGKLPYMSPEQADGRRIDSRTDIFALGVCLWEALTGRRLFRGASQAETMQKIFACQVSPPSLFRAEVPPEVDALVLKALSKDVGARYKRAADLGEAIETVAEQYALPSGNRAIAALTRALVPESGHAEGLAPDEEPTGTVDRASEVVTRQERPGAAPPKWTSDAALTMVEDERSPVVDEGQVPVDQEGLIGRAAGLADLHQLIGSGERLVTLLGPGGVGKSRLAREAARQQLSTFRGRVWVADLSGAKTVESLCLTVSESLGAVLQQARGEWAAAEESCTKAIAVHRELGNRRSEGIAVTNLADLERDRGGNARAMALYRRALGVHREVGNRRFEAICLLNQALLLMEQSTFAPAAEALDEALGLFHVVGDKRHAGLTLGARGALRAKRGEVSAGEADFRAAKELLGEKDLAFSSAVDVYRAQVDLAEEKREAAAARVEAVVKKGPQGSLAERFEHARMALRILKVWLLPPSPGGGRAPG